jgi:hypothetical protein
VDVQPSISLYKEIDINTAIRMSNRPDRKKLHTFIFGDAQVSESLPLIKEGLVAVRLLSC